MDFLVFSKQARGCRREVEVWKRTAKATVVLSFMLEKQFCYAAADEEKAFSVIVFELKVTLERKSASFLCTF